MFNAQCRTSRCLMLAAGYAALAWTAIPAFAEQSMPVQIIIPARGVVAFTPGSHHIMLMQERCR
jgi:hypothetical protein